MGELVRVEFDVLPTEGHYRPLRRSAWYSRSVPTALGLGLSVGVLSTWLSPLTLWVSLAGLVGWSIARRWRMYRFLRANDDGVAMLVSGEFAAAAEVFDKLCMGSTTMPALHSIFVYNRAVTHLESGELDRAVALLCAVLHGGWITSKGALAVYYPNVLSRLAIAEALRGRLEQAQAWRERAHTATSAPKQGALLLLDIVVEARSGHYKRVVELIEDGWGRAENHLTARQLRTLRLLQAFALERQGGAADYRAVSRETDLLRALEGARAGRAGEFGAMLAHWPELEDFARRHDI